MTIGTTTPWSAQRALRLAGIDDGEFVALIAAAYSVPRAIAGLLHRTIAAAEWPLIGTDRDRLKLAESCQTDLQLSRRKAAVQALAGFRISMANRTAGHGRLPVVTNGRFLGAKLESAGAECRAALEKPGRRVWVAMQSFA